MDTETKTYEIAYLIDTAAGEDGVLGIAGNITSKIQELNGVIEKIEEPKLRRLAYPVKKHKNAYFGWTSFSTDPAGVNDLKKRIRSDEKMVIRFLLIEIPKKVIELRKRAKIIKQRIERPHPVKFSAKEAAPQTQEKVSMEELDKKLEEILNK